MNKTKISTSLLKHVVLITGAVGMLFPFFWAFSTSLKSLREVFRNPFSLIPAHPTWNNYVAIFSKIPFARYMLNSFVVASATTLLQITTAVLGAYAFSRLNFKGKKFAFYALLATMMIPSQLLMIPQYLIIARFGWVNTYEGLIFPYAATAVSTFLMRQFFLTIPRELQDAAVIDGCNQFQILTKIFLPLSKPAISTIAVFSFMWSWNGYFWPLLVVNVPDMRTVQLGLAMFRTQGGIQWGQFMAGTIVATLPILIVYFFAQKHFIKSITLTGLKG
jgi:multiple sugar transport system permease protein